jgi:hypothetical protein
MSKKLHRLSKKSVTNQGMLQSINVSNKIS